MRVWVACIIHAAQGQRLYFKGLLGCRVCRCVYMAEMERDKGGERV